MKTKYLLFFIMFLFTLSSCTKEENSEATTIHTSVMKSFDFFDFQSNESDFNSFLESLLNNWYHSNVSGCIYFRYYEGSYYFNYAENVNFTEDDPTMTHTKETTYSFGQKERAIKFAMQQATEENKTIRIAYYKFNKKWVVTVVEEIPNSEQNNN